MKFELTDYLDGQQLAGALGRNPAYVSAMKKAGFKPTLPPNFFRLADAIAWLKSHPDFRTTTAYPSKARRKV